MSHPLGTIVAYDKNVGYICRGYACLGYPCRLPVLSKYNLTLPEFQIIVYNLKKGMIVKRNKKTQFYYSIDTGMCVLAIFVLLPNR